MDLQGSRTSGFSPNPLSFSEIEAWARLTGWAPLPREVDLLKRLDRALLETLSERTKKPS